PPVVVEYMVPREGEWRRGEKVLYSKRRSVIFASLRRHNEDRLNDDTDVDYTSKEMKRKIDGMMIHTSLCIWSLVPGLEPLSKRVNYISKFILYTTS
ncbi:hypothetical protein ACJX0J_031556, partial [Zea mays]